MTPVPEVTKVANQIGQKALKSQRVKYSPRFQLSDAGAAQTQLQTDVELQLQELLFYKEADGKGINRTEQVRGGRQRCVPPLRNSSIL